MEDKSIGFPPPEVLPHDVHDKVPFFLVGDDAFALQHYMMKPFSRRGMDMDERIFNYHLSRCRRISENAFGIMANRWQITLNIMAHEPKTCRMLVTVCIILHNYIRVNFPHLQNHVADAEDANHNIIPGEWRRGRNMTDMDRVVAPNSGSKRAKKQRLLLKHYLSSPAGSVPWQNNIV